MNKNNLELSKWGDGTIRLTYWDSLHGEDVSYILNDDDKVYIEDPSDDKHVFQIYNFVGELIKLERRINKGDTD